MTIDFILLIFGLAFIYWGAHYLINAVVFLSKRMGISLLVIGMTIVAMSTSAPELFVGILSATKGEHIISLGNIIGANLANIGLIIGIVSLIKPMKIKTSTLKKEFPFVILAPAMLYLLAMDGMMSRFDGIILLIMAFLFIYYAVWTAGTKTGIVARIKALKEDGEGNHQEILKQVIYLVLSIIILLLGAKLLLNSGLALARSFQVPEIIIGITIITLGTALPELSTSIIGLIKNKAEISLGNVIGSTVFNIFVVLGVVFTIRPLAIPAEIINMDLLVLILFTLISVTLWRTRDRMARLEGGILLLAYVGYIFYLVYSYNI